jgi:hypothetical protein
MPDTSASPSSPTSRRRHRTQSLAPAELLSLPSSVDNEASGDRFGKMRPAPYVGVVSAMTAASLCFTASGDITPHILRVRSRRLMLARRCHRYCLLVSMFVFTYVLNCYYSISRFADRVPESPNRQTSTPKIFGYWKLPGIPLFFTEESVGHRRRSSDLDLVGAPGQADMLIQRRLVLRGGGEGNDSESYMSIPERPLLRDHGVKSSSATSTNLESRKHSNDNGKTTGQRLNVETMGLSPSRISVKSGSKSSENESPAMVSRSERKLESTPSSAYPLGEPLAPPSRQMRVLSLGGPLTYGANTYPHLLWNSTSHVHNVASPVSRSPLFAAACTQSLVEGMESTRRHQFESDRKLVYESHQFSRQLLRQEREDPEEELARGWSREDNDDYVAAHGLKGSATEDYHVITVEFRFYDSTSARSLSLLLRRLRRRYKDASIVVVHLWTLDDLVAPETDGGAFNSTGVTFSRWYASLPQPMPPLGSAGLNQLLLDSRYTWRLSANYQSQLDVSLPKMVAQVDGFLVSPPFDFSGNGAGTDFTAMFDAGGKILSGHGHRVVAEAMQGKLRGRVASTALRDIASDRSWGVGDKCELLLEHGRADRERRYAGASWATLSSGIWSSSGLGENTLLAFWARLKDFLGSHAGRVILSSDVDSTSTLFPNPGNFLLKVDHHGSKIKISNPWPSQPQGRTLCLTYMTAQDEDPDLPSTYPAVTVSINGQLSVTIEPYHEVSAGEPDVSKNVLVARTTAVGIVPPGEAVVEIRPKSDKTLSKFLLIGLSFPSPEALSTIPIDALVDRDITASVAKT